MNMKYGSNIQNQRLKTTFDALKRINRDDVISGLHENVNNAETVTDTAQVTEEH